MHRLAAISIALVVTLQAGAAELVPGSVVLTHYPNPLFADPALLLFDPNSGEVSILSGRGVGSGPALSVPKDVALGPDGLLYVADNEVGVLRVDPSTGNRDVVLGRPRVDFARRVVFDSQGFLYVLDSDDSLSSGRYTSGIVYRVDLVDGTRDVVVRISGVYRFDAPRGMAITATGQLLFADLSGKIWALQPDGSFEILYSVNQSLYFVTMDPATDRPYVIIPSGPFRGLVRGASQGSFEPVSTASHGEGPFFGNGTIVGASVGADGMVYITDPKTGLTRVDVATGDRTRLIADAIQYQLYGVAAVPETPVIVDTDGDGVADVLDLCPDQADPGQEDTDGNRVGDACNDSEDADGDDYADVLDNCPYDANPAQGDRDRDGLGDACNDAVDLDGDDFRDDVDNCPEVSNDPQSDIDYDGLGDVCDPFPFDPDNEKAQLRVDLAMCLERDVFDDADGDGEEDATDACPGTPLGAETDAAGCSRPEFCASHLGDGGLIRVLLACYRADWRNDEPASLFPGDCLPRLLPVSCNASPTLP